VRRADKLTTFVYRFSRRSGSLKLLDPYESVQVYYVARDIYNIGSVGEQVIDFNPRHQYSFFP